MQYYLKWATMLALVLLLSRMKVFRSSFISTLKTWPSLSPFLCKLYIFLYLRLLLPYLRVVASNKRYNIQRRLAWSLCKDDTHNRREAKPFLCLFAPCIIVWITQLHHERYEGCCVDCVWMAISKESPCPSYLEVSTHPSIWELFKLFDWFWGGQTCECFT